MLPYLLLFAGGGFQNDFSSPAKAENADALGALRLEVRGHDAEHFLGGLVEGRDPRDPESTRARQKLKGSISEQRVNVIVL